MKERKAISAAAAPGVAPVAVGVRIPGDAAGVERGELTIFQGTVRGNCGYLLSQRRSLSEARFASDKGLRHTFAARRHCVCFPRCELRRGQLYLLIQQNSSIVRSVSSISCAAASSE